VTPTLHWLASYPKSGNTWVRLFLANYLRDEGDDPVNINDVSNGPLALQCCATDAYEAACGFVPKGEEAQLKARPLVQKFLNTLGENTPIKTHSENAAFQGIPFIDHQYTKSAIYIIRSPIDIIPSHANHFSVSYEEAFEQICEPARSLLVPDGVHTMVSSWDNHVNSWKDYANFVRYEDFPDAFQVVLNTLEIPSEGLDFDQAVADCDIERLKLQEAALGFGEQRGDDPFFSGGRMPISDDLKSRVIEKFYPLMKEFGYVSTI